MGLVGINRVFQNQSSECVRVFTLHGVADYSKNHNWVPLRHQMDQARLRQILTALSRHYRFVDMDEAVAVIRGEQPAANNVAALTFDDGYRNNFTQALPVLESLNLPATFYIATAFVTSRQPFWFDRLDYALQVLAETQVFQVGGREFSFGPGSRERLRANYASLRRHCKRVFDDEEEFVAALSGLAAQLEDVAGQSLASVIEDDHWACVASTKELRAAAEHPLVTIGSHTVNHLRLSCATDAAIATELSHSKAQLEQWTGQEVCHFAYPNGDYDNRCIAAVKHAGYRSAVTSDHGMNQVGKEIAALDRIDISPDRRPAEMLARASGLEDSLGGFVRRVLRRDQ